MHTTALQDLAAAIRTYAGAANQPQLAHLATLVIAGDGRAVDMLDGALESLSEATWLLAAKGGIEV